MERQGVPEATLAAAGRAADALVARGIALQAAAAPEAALEAFTAAVAARPGDARAHAYRGLMLLTLGRWREGWHEYAWRHARGTSLPGPRWHGGPLGGRTILVEAEQGLGDTLMMLRYVPRVAQSGGAVALAAPATFHRLLRRLPGLRRLYQPGDFLEYHVQVRLCDLPLLFGTTPATVPPPVTALWHAPGSAAARRILAAPHPRIGLVWAGNPAHPNDRNRSLPAAALRPVVTAAGGTAFSLQQGAARGALPLAGIVDLGLFADLAETAAVLAALDAVVSVDTAVAHLAGTMGKRCFLLLPAAADWRWLVGRSDTPWYPAMTLVRQDEPGDWQGAVHRLASLVMQEFQAAGARA